MTYEFSSNSYAITNDGGGDESGPAPHKSTTTTTFPKKSFRRFLRYTALVLIATSAVVHWRKDLRSFTIRMAHYYGRHHHDAMSIKKDTSSTKSASAAVVVTPHHQPQPQQQQQLQNNITSTAKGILGRQTKPPFVIHVGPSKTATTTMQEDLAEMAELGNLDQDNYAYLGRVRTVYKDSVVQSSMFDRKCLVTMKRLRNRGTKRKNNSNSTAPFAYKNVRCWKPVVDEIQSFRDKNMSIIVSTEYLSNNGSMVFRKDLFPVLVAALKETLADDWNPFVVVGFRRYAEWSISAVHQYDRLHCATLWKKDAWKFGDCEPAWNLTREWMHEKPYPLADHYHYTDEVYQLWKQHFPVKILNFHSAGHISTKFACDMLPDAPHLCDIFRNRPEMPRTNSIPSARGGYSNVVYAAWQKGLIPKTKERYIVLRNMEKYFDREFGRDIAYADLPLRDCADKEDLKELLNLSLAMEQKLVPAYFNSPQGKTEHTASFWKRVDVKREFCAVDTEAALEGKATWQEVLEGLVRRAKERQGQQP